MSEIKHTPPELEAVELEAVGWFVRTKPRTPDGTPEIVADLSMARHGKEWAHVFATSLAVFLAAKGSIREELDAVSVHPCDAHNDDVRAANLPIHAQKLYRALAAAEGRTEQADNI